jgi:translocation and assembly module TamB
VQPLDDDPTIRIGTRRPEGQFVVLPLRAPAEEETPSSLRLRVAANLGKDVLIRRGADLRVAVSGRPVLHIGAKTQVTGPIWLQSGMMDVFGKRFTLEHGSVTFSGEPSNPEIVATAYWDAPEGTRVFADVTGTAQKLRVKLRSEPARTQNEIIALVLFGTTEGATAAPPPGQSSTTTQAAGALGGFVAPGLNRLLSSISPFQVQTRVDTGQAQNPRPEVEVQLSRDVTLDVIYNLGLPPPGQNPDRTQLRLGWRFSTHWSLETILGDQGSSIVDLVWHYRY